jgi:hypothetical protein
VHVPAWQLSVCVQELPSLQDVPSGLLGFEQTPVPGLQVPGAWHWSFAEQVTVFAPVHAPAWQVSVCVQGLPSLQDVPSALLGFEQAPVTMLQVPAVWHWSIAEQVTVFAPVHAPAWQVSVCVQELPSLQDVPSALLGFEQTPVPGLQVPAAWHWSRAAHVTGLAPVHVPAWQVSVCVQKLPSLQDVPSALLGFVQTPVPVLQVPATWH